jgi:2-polyprenyl-3-methyl-5-hydroxy-6-metoxy-1,4-benzoquinol methylase
MSDNQQLRVRKKNGWGSVGYRKIFQNYYHLHFKFHHSNLGALKKNYQKTFYLWKSYFEPYISGFDKNKAKVLDVGCGLGQNMWAMKELGFRDVRGIDISQDLVQICWKMGLNVECQEMFSFLEGRKDKYDIILFFDVIEHLFKDEVVRIIKLFNNHLNKNGVLIIHTANAEFPYSLRTRYIDITHELSFTDESLHDVLILGGFNRIKIFGVNSFYIYHPNFFKRVFRLLFLKIITNSAELFHRLLALCQGAIIKNLKRSLVSFSWKD